MHRCLTVDHAVIKIEVKNLCTECDLLLGNRHGLIEITCDDQFLEGQATSDVAAFANIDELDMVSEDKLLHAREHHAVLVLWDVNATLQTSHSVIERLDIIGRGSTAATDHVDEAICRVLSQVDREVLWRLIVPSHGVG